MNPQFPTLLAEGFWQNAQTLATSGAAHMHLAFLPHLLVSLLLGFVIGLERRSRHKAIGVRTFMVMAGSSAMIAYYGVAFSLPGSGADPTRLAAQMLSGMTWIGIAITVVRRGGFTSAGVTTAAMMILSVVAGIGCGLGLFGPAILGTLLVIAAVTLSRRFMRSAEFSPPVKVLCLETRREEVLDLFGVNRCITSWKKSDSGFIELTVQPVISPHEAEQLIERLIEREYVRSAHLDVD